MVCNLAEKALVPPWPDRTNLDSGDLAILLEVLKGFSVALPEAVPVKAFRLLSSLCVRDNRLFGDHRPDKWNADILVAVLFLISAHDPQLLSLRFSPEVPLRFLTSGQTSLKNSWGRSRDSHFWRRSRELVPRLFFSCFFGGRMAPLFRR